MFYLHLKLIRVSPAFENEEERTRIRKREREKETEVTMGHRPVSDYLSSSQLTYEEYKCQRLCEYQKILIKVFTLTESD